MIQGQDEGISTNEVLAGNRGESLGSWCRQAPMLLKQSAPKAEKSLLNACEGRMSAKPNKIIIIKKKELSNQRSRDSESLATEDKVKDGRYVGPNYLSPR